MIPVGDFLFDNKRKMLVRAVDFSQEEFLQNLPASPDEDKQVLVDALDYCYSKIPFRIHGLNELGICLTNNCNFICNYCMDSATSGKADYLNIFDILSFVKKGLEYRAIKKIVNQEDIPLKIYFTGGGEQTYNWTLFRSTVEEIDKYMKNEDISVEFGLTTNGLLNDEQLDFITHYFSNVMVSFDGLPQIQKRNRPLADGTDSTDFVNRTISYLLNKDSIQITVRSTVWPCDFSSFTKMFDFLADNYSGHFIWELHPVMLKGRAIETSEKMETYNLCRFVDNYFNLINYASTKTHSFDISQTVLPVSTPQTSCGACSPYCNMLWLVPGNNIITCIESFENSTHVGMIKDGQVIMFDSVDDPLLYSCIKNMIMCQDCIAYPFCKGGCPLKNMGQYRNSPNCQMIKYFWQVLLQKLLKENELFGWALTKETVAGIEVYLLKRSDTNNENPF